MAQNNMNRGLNSRHISMIAIGGAIGTGLFVATGSVISQAGPGGAILAYLIIGVMLYFLMSSIGELATFYPVSGSFSSYSTRFVDSSLGFTMGWLYWAIWLLVTSVDIIISPRNRGVKLGLGRTRRRCRFAMRGRSTWRSRARRPQDRKAGR